MKDACLQERAGVLYACGTFFRECHRPHKSGFWGRGEFEGRGPFLPQAKGVSPLNSSPGSDQNYMPAARRMRARLASLPRKAMISGRWGPPMKPMRAVRRAGATSLNLRPLPSM